MAHAFIAKRIAGHDVLIPGADGFLLVFSAHQGLLADAAAQRISKALNDFFIGTEDSDVRLAAKRREMSVEDLTGAYAPAPKPQADALRFVYRPLWDARRQAVTASFVCPLDVAGGPLAGWSFETGPDIARPTVEVDEASLNASELALRQLQSSGRKAYVGVNVHVGNLTTQAGLTRLFAAMSSFDRELARLRVVRICGVEAGFPRIYLEDIVRTLRSRAPNLAFALHWSEADIGSALKLQPMAAGFTLPPEGMGGPTRAELQSRVKAASEQAHAHHLPFFVDGHFPGEQAQVLLAAGADRLSSPLVWPHEAQPVAAARWPATRLMETATIDA